jgi:hypothetical protein
MGERRFKPAPLFVDPTKRDLLDELAHRNMKLVVETYHYGLWNQNRTFFAEAADGTRTTLDVVMKKSRPDWKSMIDALPGPGIIRGL